MMSHILWFIFDKISVNIKTNIYIYIWKYKTIIFIRGTFFLSRDFAARTIFGPKPVPDRNGPVPIQTDQSQSGSISPYQDQLGSIRSDQSRTGPKLGQTGPRIPGFTSENPISVKLCIYYIKYYFFILLILVCSWNDSSMSRLSVWWVINDDVITTSLWRHKFVRRNRCSLRESHLFGRM